MRRASTEVSAHTKLQNHRNNGPSASLTNRSACVTRKLDECFVSSTSRIVHPSDTSPSGAWNRGGVSGTCTWSSVTYKKHPQMPSQRFVYRHNLFRIQAESKTTCGSPIKLMWTSWVKATEVQIHAKTNPCFQHANVLCWILKGG